MHVFDLRRRQRQLCELFVRRAKTWRMVVQRLFRSKSQRRLSFFGRRWCLLEILERVLLLDEEDRDEDPASCCTVVAMIGMPYGNYQVFVCLLHRAGQVKTTSFTDTGASTSTGWPKTICTFLYALSLHHTRPIFKPFHCQKHKKMCNNTIT